VTTALVLHIATSDGTVVGSVEVATDASGRITGLAVDALLSDIAEQVRAAMLRGEIVAEGGGSRPPTTLSGRSAAPGQSSRSCQPRPIARSTSIQTS
jgi:hypothetical protein